MLNPDDLFLDVYPQKGGFLFGVISSGELLFIPLGESAKRKFSSDDVADEELWELAWRIGQFKQVLVEASTVLRDEFVILFAFYALLWLVRTRRSEFIDQMRWVPVETVFGGNDDTSFESGSSDAPGSVGESCS